MANLNRGKRRIEHAGGALSDIRGKQPGTALSGNAGYRVLRTVDGGRRSVRVAERSTWVRRSRQVGARFALSFRAMHFGARVRADRVSGPSRGSPVLALTDPELLFNLAASECTAGVGRPFGLRLAQELRSVGGRVAVFRRAATVCAVVALAAAVSCAGEDDPAAPVEEVSAPTSTQQAAVPTSMGRPVRGRRR